MTSFIILTILIIQGVLLFPLTSYATGEPAIDTGTTSWMLTSTALVLLMIPGLAMFYGGLVRKKNVLGTMMHSFVAMGVMAVLWIILGYSMSFGDNVLGGFCGWNKDYLFLNGIDTKIMESGIPEYVFSMFQGKFAMITPALMAGAFAERVTFKGYIVFIATWGIFVYNPLCHWVWFDGGAGNQGFLYSMGAIDFAGGTVVHISAGVSGLVAALYLGSRRGHKKNVIPPSNMVMTMMGAGLLWVGWFGFNAGSSVSSGLSTAQALAATQAAAASGAITWMMIEGFHQGKATALGFASGILAGLVAVTPAAGVVKPLGALTIGAAASIACYIAILIKDKLGYDDSLDAFGLHGVGGIVGALLLVFFMRGKHSAEAIFAQLGIQFLAVAIAIIYAAVLTLVIVWVIEKTIGLRSDEQDEIIGMDASYHGEHGYGMMNF
ncbi:MAG: ammonium transporter [Desulfobacteraceae bacterium]|nr:ammonium transporter [Desulfobacteraceae bacterium]